MLFALYPGYFGQVEADCDKLATTFEKEKIGTSNRRHVKFRSFGEIQQLKHGWTATLMNRRRTEEMRGEIT